MMKNKIRKTKQNQGLAIRQAIVLKTAFCSIHLGNYSDDISLENGLAINKEDFFSVNKIATIDMSAYTNVII